MKPISSEYLTQTFEVKPGDRLHRLIARMADTYFDDLSDDRIEALEQFVDDWRWMNASGTRLPD